MVEEKYVYDLISNLKQNINKTIKQRKYEDSLNLISICARILYLTNIYYVDEDLESFLNIISQKLKLYQNFYKTDDNQVLFYDGFGFNDRGLVQIYLKALCKIKKVIYVTYSDRKEFIPDVKDMLEKHGCKLIFIDRKNNSNINCIKQLSTVFSEMNPNAIFYYSTPSDVIMTTMLYALNNKVKRYQINLTDHAYWLGTRCFDICIEFRNFGASISKDYRKIAKDRIKVIPFYPNVNKKMAFQGFPFDKTRHQKIIFSGGQLYKTFGENNKYYKIVDYLLTRYENTIFWYAGTGDDSEMQKILKKYPNRAYLTAERSDLYQVLENIDIYLSTYPLCGGLMFQYAASAGKVPVTLKKNNVSDDFLLNQESLNIEFKNEIYLYEEIDRLLNDEEYYTQRGELMKCSVTSQKDFEHKIKKMLDNNSHKEMDPVFRRLNLDNFKEWYLENTNELELNELFVSKKTISVCLKYYPIILLKGGIFKVVKKLKKR